MSRAAPAGPAARSSRRSATSGRAGQVEQRLAEAIRSGVLVEGERLPSETELAGRLGVAVVTVREALVGLRAQGLGDHDPRARRRDLRGRRSDRRRGGPRRASRGHVARRAPRPRHPVRPRARRVRRAGRRARGRGGGRLAASPDRDRRSTAETTSGAWRHADAELWLSLAALTQSARITREVVRLEADFGMIVRIPLERPGIPSTHLGQPPPPGRRRRGRRSRRRTEDRPGPPPGDPRPGRPPPGRRPGPPATEECLDDHPAANLTDALGRCALRGHGLLRRALRVARADRRPRVLGSSPTACR